MLALVTVAPVLVELVASSALSERVEDVTTELSVVEVVSSVLPELVIVAVGDAVIELLVVAGAGAEVVGILMLTLYAEHSVSANSMTAGSLSQAVDQRNCKAQLVGTYLQLR